MLRLRALNACISFLLLILLGCRQFCPVCLCSFCIALLWLTVLPLLVGAVVSSGLACSICAPPCYTTVFNLCSSVSLLHASGVLLEFFVTVVSVLKCTFGFAFCPVAVYTMILCSCMPLEVLFVTCNELSLVAHRERAYHAHENPGVNHVQWPVEA
jgi:hypothetical protein